MYSSSVYSCHLFLIIWQDPSKWKGLRDEELEKVSGIKKRWQEYTEELYKKDLQDQDNHDGVITHLEPDILECEVKWVLESISTNKASGGDGTPAELFQIQKDGAMKVLQIGRAYV